MICSAVDLLYSCDTGDIMPAPLDLPNPLDPSPPDHLTDDEFRTVIRRFMAESDQTIEAYALHLDPTNIAPHCSCAYHMGRASVYLHQKLDHSIREAVSVVRKSMSLDRYTDEMRHAIVSACEQIADWTLRNVQETLGVRVELRAPDRASVVPVPPVQFTSPAMKGTH